MADPRDFNRDPRLNPRDNPAHGMRGDHSVGGDGADTVAPGSRRPGSSMWAWFAGFVAAVFIIAIVWGFSTKNPTQTMLDRNRPAATTGSGATTSPDPNAAGAGSTNVPAPSGAGGR